MIKRDGSAVQFEETDAPRTRDPLVDGLIGLGSEPQAIFDQHRRLLAWNEGFAARFGAAAERLGSAVSFDAVVDAWLGSAAKDGAGGLQLRRQRSEHGDLLLCSIVPEEADDVADLRRSCEFLQNVIRTLPFAVSVKDMRNEGRYVLWSGRLGDWTTLPPEAGIGRTDADLFSIDVVKASCATDDAVVRTGKTVTSETTLIGKDGASVISETRHMAVRGPDDAVRYVLRITDDITQRRHLEIKLARAAMHDALTGLPNRLLFRERLRGALRRREDSGGLVALHSLDLDHFKQVNDTLGHATGDALLVAVGKRLEGLAGPTSFVARLAGDEFAVIQAGIARPEMAISFAKRIADSVRQPFEIDGKHILAGCSIGIAIAPDHGLDPDTILQHADHALYAAKSEKRGACRLFDEEMSARIQSQLCLEQDILGALALEQFEVFYQPVLALADHQVVGFEALLRWRHPRQGLLPAATFIGLAEDMGLIVQIGDWMLRQACEEAASWPDPLSLSINLSPAQLKHPGIATTMIAILARSGLSTSRLELEVTEATLLAIGEGAISTLHQLRALGVRIALDDFGTGSTSLHAVRSFPFSKIKIDRSFSNSDDHSHETSAFRRSVIRLAGDLGMTVTAEGVETLDQLHRLRSDGCGEAQGMIFAKPHPAEALTDLLGKLKPVAARIAP